MIKAYIVFKISGKRLYMSVYSYINVGCVSIQLIKDSMYVPHNALHLITRWRGIRFSRLPKLS